MNLSKAAYKSHACFFHLFLCGLLLSGQELKDICEPVEFEECKDQTKQVCAPEDTEECKKVPAENCKEKKVVCKKKCQLRTSKCAGEELGIGDIVDDMKLYLLLLMLIAVCGTFRCHRRQVDCLCCLSCCFSLDLFPLSG